jgi:hypothetical protein
MPQVNALPPRGSHLEGENTGMHKNAIRIVTWRQLGFHMCAYKRQSISWQCRAEGSVTCW